MAYMTVAVVPVGADRFALVLSNPAAAPSQVPSVGDNPQGYTEEELRRSLHECHGNTPADGQISSSILSTPRGVLY